MNGSCRGRLGVRKIMINRYISIDQSVSIDYANSSKHFILAAETFGWFIWVSFLERGRIINGLLAHVCCVYLLYFFLLYSSSRRTRGSRTGPLLGTGSFGSKPKPWFGLWPKRTGDWVLVLTGYSVLSVLFPQPTLILSL